MKTKTLVKTALVGSLVTGTVACNPFSIKDMDQGYQNSQTATKTAEAKCGEAKCGATKTAEAKCGEAKCGATKTAEAKCGGAK